ncbi:hypothetical protein IAU60_000211 [Kwoniella sp. DSM 27419]
MIARITLLAVLATLVAANPIKRESTLPAIEQITYQADDLSRAGRRLRLADRPDLCLTVHRSEIRPGVGVDIATCAEEQDDASAFQLFDVGVPSAGSPAIGQIRFTAVPSLCLVSQAPVDGSKLVLEHCKGNYAQAPKAPRWTLTTVGSSNDRPRVQVSTAGAQCLDVDTRSEAHASVPSDLNLRTQACKDGNSSDDNQWFTIL